MIYADEIGTIPKIGSFEMMMMLSAGRSRKISLVSIIQSFAQIRTMEKKAVKLKLITVSFLSLADLLLT